MTPSEKRRKHLAQLAYDRAEDKEATEKNLSVSEEVFEKCIADMPEHYRTTHRKRGYLRIYHKPFWTENPDSYGKTYHHGIVYLVNVDSPVNKEYQINSVDGNFEQLLSEALKVKRHRLIAIYGDYSGNVEVRLIPQRINFDD